MIKYKNTIIKNIYHMLSYAYHDLQHENYKNIQTEEFENIYDLFTMILAKGILHQLKHGLYREYVEINDNLFTLRGKINIKNTINLKLRNENKISCNFDELSENNYMNKILKTTAFYLLIQSDIKQKNKDLLKKAIQFFSKIDRLEISDIKWNRLIYNRNNATYRILMNICYLILHELLLTTSAGDKKLATFIDDQSMSRLFEKFVLSYYEKHFQQFNPSSREIKWNTFGNTKYLPSMQSDVMLIDDKNNRKLIIDAKFYGTIMQKQYDVDTIRSNHLYQIYSYVKNEDKYNSGKVDGILLYAKTDIDIIPTDIEYQLGNNRISIKTLDLNKDFSNIKSQLNLIINEWQK